MKTDSFDNKTARIKLNPILPKALQHYQAFDFGIQQKARFIFYLCIAMIVGLFVIIVTTSVIQIFGNEYNGIYLPIMLPEVALLFLFVICLFLLAKGYYSISAHFLIASSFVCVWFIMVFDKADNISKLDTIVYIVALLNIMPLFITRYKSTILIYLTFNIAALLSFVLLFGDQIGLSQFSKLDYFIDSCVAMLFTGVLGYYILKINQGTLDKSLLEIEERKVIEEELKQSRDQFQSLVSNIPGITYRCLNDKDWTMIYISSEIDAISGYSSSDFINNQVRTYESIINKEDNNRNTELVNQAIQSGNAWEFEYRINHRDGSIRWAYEKGRAVLNNVGEIVYLDGFILDVTKQKRIENLLEESEEKYKILIETSQDGISLLDINGIMLFSNKRKAEMLHASSESELIGKSIYSLLKESSHIEMQNNISKIITKGHLENIESEVIRFDGTVFYAEFNFSLLRKNDGSPLYLMETIRDISRRKKQQEAELRFRNLFENAQIGICQTTPEGKILNANPSLIKMLGYNSFEELEIKKTDNEVTFAQELNKDFDKIINNEEWIKGNEAKWKTKNGDTIIIVENSRAVRDNSGKIIYFESFVENITEKKRIEIELEKYRNHLEFIVKERTEELNQNIEELLVTRESLEKKNKDLQQLQLELLNEKSMVDALMESIPDAIYFKDLQSRFMKVSKSMEINFNKTDSSGMIGKTDFSYFTEDRAKQTFDEEQQIIKTLNPILEIIEKETWKNGKITYVSTTKMPLYTAEGEVIGTFGLSRDITKLIEMEEAIKQQNEELLKQRQKLESTLKNLQQTQNKLAYSEKMASLGVLAAGVAHEINNPLNFIQGGLLGLESYFEENLQNHLQEVYPMINGIQVGLSRAADIVTSLNHYSRQDDISTSECNIHQVIDNCLIMLQNQLKHRIEIVKNYTDVPHNLHCNEGKMHQAILNVLANASQSINEKGNIIITTTIENLKLHISISDTGCGIKEGNISKIMDPFFTTKDVGKGTGLGLSITYNIIQEHKGTIEFESNLNMGTNVIIKLPLHFL